jgi:hypothetical protein
MKKAPFEREVLFLCPSGGISGGGRFQWKNIYSAAPSSALPHLPENPDSPENPVIPDSKVIGYCSIHPE